ncbi:uncharacterized protein LOC106133963 [Amyelois transitella]|uniref:uncharacterized protein LOC106133963 n=1 Tax=Amyelois transitella TaxID=680683 RepID=UPI00067C90EA|nr:uncharacterized protein LOC106133963 [Amyelois transitella]
MVLANLSCISNKLTEEIIQNAFRIKTGSADNVMSIKVKRAAPAGEGLISAVYRITVEGQHHKASFIAKGLINDPLLRKSIICSETFFEREAFFYTNILPAMAAVQKSLGAKESLQRSIPVCYGSYVDGKNDYIIIEDLAENGCESLTYRPTEDERDATLKTLAHIHAVSMALRETKPEVFNKIADKLPEAYYNKQNKDWYVTYLNNAIEIDREVLAEFEDPSTSVYYKKFEQLVSHNVYDQLIQLTAHRDERAVFNHGDAWTPNFLYSGELTVAIDFQAFRCVSVALDLSYFIILCGNLVQKKEDFEKAVKVYYNFLKYYLRDMGLNENVVCSWPVLNDELKKYGKFGLLAALTSIPLLVSEKCDVLEKFEHKFVGYDKIPLEDLWKLTPIECRDDKLWLVNAVRISVDMGLI